MHQLSAAFLLQSAAIPVPAMSLVVFQKTLHDLVKGIRAHKKDPSLFISQAIAEIKQELKSNDPFVKAQAVRAGSGVLWHGRTLTLHSLVC